MEQNVTALIAIANDRFMEKVLKHRTEHGVNPIPGARGEIAKKSAAAVERVLAKQNGRVSRTWNGDLVQAARKDLDTRFTTEDFEKKIKEIKKTAD